MNIFSGTSYFKPFTADLWKPSLRRSLGCVLAIFIAIFLRLENPYWACITAFTVVQSDTGSSVKRCFERIAATISGTIIALIIAKLYLNHPAVLLINILVIVSLIMSYSYRKNSYLALLASITFIMIIFNIYTDPNSIINVAFFRCTEVSVGIIAETIVSIVIFPNHASSTIKKLEEQTIESYYNFVDLILQNCNAKKDNHTEFNNKYKILLDNLEKLNQLRNNAKIEKLLFWKKNKNSFCFEHYITLNKQLIVEYYQDYFACKLDYDFDFLSLNKIFLELKNTLLDLSHAKISLDIYNDKIKELTGVIEQIDSKYSIRLYLSLSFHLLNIGINLPVSPLARINNESPVSKFIDMSYFKQGIKAAIGAITVPIIWIVFNLPGLSQISVSAMVLMKLDQADMESAALLRLTGCIIGVCLSLIIINLDITNFIVYLLLVFASIFLFSYMLYSDSKSSYLPLQAVFGLAVTLVDNNYLTSLSPGLERGAGIFFGIISVLIVNQLIWPMSTKDICRLQIAQIQEKFANMANIIKKDFSSVPDSQFYELHQAILQIRNLHCKAEVKISLYESSKAVFYMVQTIFALLLIRGNNITDPTRDNLYKALELLEKVASATDKEYMVNEINNICYFNAQKELRTRTACQSEYLLMSQLVKLLHGTSELGKQLMPFLVSNSHYQEENLQK